MPSKMSVQSVFSLLFTLLFFVACDDGSQVTIYDKNLTSSKLKCLSYIPASKEKLDLELSKLYKFSSNCPYQLKLSYKSNIKCNSSYNVFEKTTTNFPSSFISLEVRKGLTIKYSYYKDLTSKADKDDLKKAFSRLKRDILEN